MNLKDANFLTYLILPFVFLLASCMEEEKSVTLGSSVIDKGISMTSSNAEQAKVEVYLITTNSVEGELLAKALNAKGKEIGRSKQMLNLGKDDAKLVSFTFDASVNLEEVSRFMLDFRNK
ncbi:MAG: hypothetical protein O2874_04360 [Verrucomicrobia bacterium]|jgi:hypothetical protein|nr:hypothetical protein [Verrucomicrobiota bacterium]